MENSLENNQRLTHKSDDTSHVNKCEQICIVTCKTGLIFPSFFAGNLFSKFYLLMYFVGFWSHSFLVLKFEHRGFLWIWWYFSKIHFESAEPFIISTDNFYRLLNVLWTRFQHYVILWIRTFSAKHALKHELLLNLPLWPNAVRVPG